MADARFCSLNKAFWYVTSHIVNNTILAAIPVTIWLMAILGSVLSPTDVMFYAVLIPLAMHHQLPGANHTGTQKAASQWTIVLITAPSGSSCSFNNSLYNVGRSLLPSISRKVTEGSSRSLACHWICCNLVLPLPWIIRINAGIDKIRIQEVHTAHSGIFGRQPVFPAHWYNPSFSHLLILGKTVQCGTWGNAFTLESHIACHGNTCINHNEQQQ